MRYLPSSLLVIIIVIGFAPVAAETIKKTSSGICHPPESSYYNRTENFHAFDSLETCVASGGRLPKQLASNNAPKLNKHRANSYRRSAFGHGWNDSDGDCQNSRAEALIASSSTPVRFASDNRCRVVAGRWISPFTGNVIQNSQDIDIDHVVPLKWAWERGADTWSSEKRERFANDPVNLWPVELALNRQGCKAAERVVTPQWSMRLCRTFCPDRERLRPEARLVRVPLVTIVYRFVSRMTDCAMSAGRGFRKP